MALAAAMKTNTSVTTIDLIRNNIGNSAAIALATQDQHCLDNT
jgi:hypothetical protein